MFQRTILSLALGASLLSAQPIPDRPEKLAFAPLTFEIPRAKAFKAALKNGIPVYIYGDPTAPPIVRIGLQIQGGAYLDPKGKEGLAGFCGGLLSSGGTEKMPAEQLDERLDFLAADISSSFGGISGGVSMHCMQKDLSETLGLFMQVLTKPAFAQDRLDLAKANALEGMKTRNDDIERIVGYQLPMLLNGEHHFSTAHTTEASVKAITREDLKAFHARVMHPANMVLVVSGNFEKNTMLETLNQTIGSLKPGKDAQPSPKIPPPAFTRKPGIYLVDRDAPQCMVQLAIPGLRRTDPDWHAVMVMNDLLGGGGFSSRLMKKIRSDEGLTYGIGSGLSEGAYWKGNWSCGFQTKNASVAYAMRLALAEIERMKQQPVTDEELAVIKNGIIQSFPSGWADKKAVIGTFASEFMEGWPEDWWVDYREKIQAITKEEVQRIAKKYLNMDQMVLIVVGNTTEAQAGDKNHPGQLKDVINLPIVQLPLRDPMTMKPMVQ